MAARGYYLLLAQFPAGKHVIHFKWTLSEWAFTVEETYALTVK